MSKLLLLLLFIFLSFLILYSPNFYRLYKLANLYNEDKISHNFINMDDFFHTSNPIPASKSPYVFEKFHMDLPKTYTFEGQELDLNEGLKHFNTDGLIILHDDKVLFEQYWNGNDQQSKHISWSVAKSFLSALIGIAVEEGLIDSIDDPATKYLPDFVDTGYEGVKIKNILQMSSGVAFNEEYAIKKTVEGLKFYFDNIIVVDDCSTDKT